jgi:hypothetical protein
MWSSREYAGKEFEMTWEDGEDALFRIYTKSMNGKTIIRQEYPNVTFEQAIEEKLRTVEA